MREHASRRSGQFKRKTNRLVMLGHPLDGTYLGHHEAWLPIIDHWLDYGDVPPPCV
jgi:hypothetical protein